MNKLLLEKWYPIAVGVLATSVAFTLFACYGVRLPQGESLLASLVSLGGILAGFLATMKTMLMGMKDETLNRLRQSGYMPYLKNYLSEALWSALILCVASVIGFSPSIGSSNTIYLSILIGILAYAFAALYRMTRIGMGLLTQK
jgi:hypothetical protein